MLREFGWQGAARCYTYAVPTSHPRHTITETPPVREALDGLRARLADQRIDFAELVVLVGIGETICEREHMFASSELFADPSKRLLAVS
jgi:hypothetical protein